MSRFLALFCVAIAATLAPLAHAAWGDRDCSFGTNGIQTLPGSGNPVVASLLADGNILVRTGFFETTDSISVRMSPAGVLLPMVAGAHALYDVRDPTDVSLGTGQILMLVGTGFGAGGVKRLLSDGSIDTTFGSNGYATVANWYSDMAGPIVQPDGKIVIGGWGRQQPSLVRAGLARFNADGTPDMSFGSSGLVTNSNAGAYMSIALQSDGKVLALDSNGLWRHLADGQIDVTFGTGGKVAFPTAIRKMSQVRIQPSGKILVAANADSEFGLTPLRVTRYDASGAMEMVKDVTVNLPSGQEQLLRTTFDQFHLLPDGRPVFIGTIRENTGAIVRMNADLTDDVGAFLEFLPTVALTLPGGKMVVGALNGHKVYGLLGDGDPASCTGTTTAVSSAPNPSASGDSVTITATVTAAANPPATGTVQFQGSFFNIGAPVALSGGSASISRSDLPVGTTSLKAVYLPSGTFLTSAATVAQVVLPKLSVDDPSANSAQGPTTLTFTVTLSGAATSTVMVSYATSDHTAIAGVDYTATSGTLTFNPGETSKQVGVPIAGQVAPAPPKDFYLTLSSPTNAVIAKGTGTGGIVYSQAVWGERDCTFGTSGVATAPPQTGGNPFSATVDASGNLFVQSGSGITSTFYRIAADGMSKTQLGTSFQVNLGDTTVAVLASGNVLIVTGDGAPGGSPPPAVGRYLAAGGLDTTFGASGYATVSGLKGAAAGPVVQPDGKILVGGASTSAGAQVSTLVRFNADGTPDNTFGTGGLAAIAGAGTKYVSIALQPDGKIVALSTTHLARHLANGQLDTSFGTGGTVSITSFSPGKEVRIQPTGHIVTAARNTFASGVLITRYDSTGVLLTSRTIRVPTLPTSFDIWQANYGPATLLHLMADGRPVVAARIRNLQDNADIGAIARFNTDLSDDRYAVLDFIPTFATVLPSGRILVGNFRNSEVRRLLSEADASTCILTTTDFVSNPNPSTVGSAATLTAMVTAASGPTPTGFVQFRSSGANLGSPVALTNGVATSSFNSQFAAFFDLTADYLPAAGLAGSTDYVDHHVNYGITVNDPTASALVANPSLTFTVSLIGGASATTITVDYATADNSAKAGIDYTATSGTLTFNSLATSKTVTVPLTPQTVPGPTKKFFLTLSNPSTYSGLVRGAGVGTITYTSPGSLSIFVSDAAVIEGSTGVTTLMGFTVSLSQATTSNVTVDYATANDTAVAGTDYTAKSGTLTFHPGQTQQWVIVPVPGNTVAQSNRTLFVNLSNASSGTIARAQATGTIVDDDPTPAATQVAMYRLFSNATKEHLYTTDGNEYAILGTNNWAPEGTAYTMFANPGTYGPQTTIPFFRMYHPGILQHHWTTDSNEVVVLASQGAWQYEGIAGYLLPAADAGTTPLYRLMLPAPPLHLWTTDANEKNVLTTPQQGWQYEGIVGEVLP